MTTTTTQVTKIDRNITALQKVAGSNRDLYYALPHSYIEHGLDFSAIREWLSAHGNLVNPATGMAAQKMMTVTLMSLYDNK